MKRLRSLGVGGALIALIGCSGQGEKQLIYNNYELEGSGGSSTLSSSAGFVQAATERGIGILANTGISPTSLRVKIYKFSISESVLCTNPITIYENESPEYVNMLGNPDIGTGSAPNGTYNCAIMEMSDYILPTPAETSDGGACVANSEYTQDVCGSNNPTEFVLTDGTTGTCASGEQRIPIYLSTASTTTTGSQNNNPFKPPTDAGGDATLGMNLGSALVITGASSGVFTVNGSGAIIDRQEGSARVCDMNPPTFSFQ